MTTTYTITLKNCAFFARHGLHDAEEFLGQRFFVDAELDVRPSQPLSDDAIESTVDYGVAFQEIEKIVTGQRRYLIEALANDPDTRVIVVVSKSTPSIDKVPPTGIEPTAVPSGCRVTE